MAEHHGREILTSEVVTHDLLDWVRNRGPSWIAIVLFGLLGLVGIVCVVMLLLSGPLPYAKWGYTAAALGFLVSTAQATPVLAFATRFAKGYWAIPLRRAAEIYTLSGLITTPLFIILLNQLPGWDKRWSIWNDWPGAPQFWDSVAILLISFAGLALLYLTNIPDFAAARDAGMGDIYRRLALGWTGTIRQWRSLRVGLVPLGAFYLMWLTYVHVFLVSDLAMSLVPGWKSAIFPAYHEISSLQAGVATTLITLYLIRRLGHLERYIGVDPFWGASKLMLGLTLLFFYFTWSEFLPYWYARIPEEMHLIDLLMLGVYRGFFILSFSLCFITPFLLLIWNPIRKSVTGPTAVACIILLGHFIDRIRIYVASWSVAGPVGQHLDHMPAVYWPGLLDIGVVVGAISGTIFLYLLALKVVPPISIWEYKTALLYTVERRYLRTEVAVVAKPG
jgi:molybdopterin-containing oxidoreductase family membrane subunit